MEAYRQVVIVTEGDLCGIGCGQRMQNQSSNFSFITVYTCYLYNGEQLIDEGNFRTKRCAGCLKDGN